MSHFCFIDEEDNMQIDLVEALAMFEIAAEQLLREDIRSDELPFFLFMCGAEAVLRSSDERVSMH